MNNIENKAISFKNAQDIRKFQRECNERMYKGYIHEVDDIVNIINKDYCYSILEALEMAKCTILLRILNHVAEISKELDT